MRLGVGTLPEDMGGRHLWGLGALAGIEFTVALFVTDLAYGSVSEIGVDLAKIASSLLPWSPGSWARPCCSGLGPPRRASQAADRWARPCIGLQGLPCEPRA